MVVKKIKSLKEDLLEKEVHKLVLEKARLSAQLASETAKKSADVFHIELKKAVGTAIVAAFSFLIALVWKDLITFYVTELTKASPFQGQLVSAGIITLICVVGIVLVTKFFSVPKPTEIKL